MFWRREHSDGSFDRRTTDHPPPPLVASALLLTQSYRNTSQCHKPIYYGFSRTRRGRSEGCQVHPDWGNGRLIITAQSMVDITTDSGKREATGVKDKKYVLASPLCCVASQEKSIRPTKLTSAIRGSTTQNIGVAISGSSIPYPNTTTTTTTRHRGRGRGRKTGKRSIMSGETDHHSRKAAVSLRFLCTSV